ncbi:MAG TPA: hypothetical protein VIH67_16810, partial [Candidatus Acidoferrum sp.]
ETWSSSHDQLTLDVSGFAGTQYELEVWDAAQIERVEGADLKKKPEGAILLLQIPVSGSQTYARTKVVIHFAKLQNKGKHP